MRVLLDTHIYLWYLDDSKKLSPRGRKAIAEAEEVFVSSICVWEAAIKFSVRRLPLDIDSLARKIELSGFVELPVHAKYAPVVANLPRHHGDPFDRMLVAQALYEPLALVSADPIMQKYLPNAILV